MPNFTALYHNTFQDKKFCALHIESQLLFLYLLANNNINLVGIYDLNPELVNFELKKCTRGFNINVLELISNKMVKWDPENNKIWIINRFKLLANRNPKVIIGALNSLEALDHPFRKEFIEKYKDALKPYLYKIEHQAPSSFLDENQLQYLVKIYHTKVMLKRFLIDRGVSEAQIENALAKYLPNLK